MDARTELDALQAEARDLAAQLAAAEAEAAETVAVEGTATAESETIHDIRNRLQIIQARVFRLERELKTSTE